MVLHLSAPLPLHDFLTVLVLGMPTVTLLFSYYDTQVYSPMIGQLHACDCLFSFTEFSKYTQQNTLSPHMSLHGRLTDLICSEINKQMHHYFQLHATFIIPLS